MQCHSLFYRKSKENIFNSSSVELNQREIKVKGKIQCELIRLLGCADWYEMFPVQGTGYT